jgi:hypothetical protein
MLAHRLLKRSGKAGFAIPRRSGRNPRFTWKMVPLVCGGKVELLEDKKLITQFRRLQRRRGRNGRDVIDHIPGATDDLCNAVCDSAVVSAQSFGSQPLIVVESAGKRAFVRELDSVFPRRRYGWLDEF